jgi:hypothetical protein
MGWFSDAVDAGADAVEDVFEEGGEAVGTGFEAAGDAIDDGLTWAGGQTGPVGGAVFGWLGGVVNGAFNLVGSANKAAWGIAGGVLGGTIRIIGGILSLDESLILVGLGDIFSSILGGIILVLGKAVALIQVIFTLGRERPLTEKEKRQLRRAFRDSLNYYVIRIAEGHGGLFQPGANRFALGNTIYFKNYPVTYETLVHECTHVWQYQNGGARYVTDNLWAAVTEYAFNDPNVYVYEINEGKMWEEFHPEAQAELIEAVWVDGELLSGGVVQQTGDGAFYDADNVTSYGRFIHYVDYTHIANDAVAALRDGRTPDWGFW